jgi:hypothetical protein
MAAPISRSAPRAFACALAMLLALLMSACGGGSPEGGSDVGGGSREAAQKTNFPSVDGKTLGDLQKELGQGGPVLAPTVSILEPGRNRLGFGLFDRARKQIQGVPTAVYLSPMSGGPASGPYYADAESLAVKPPFQSQTVKNDPEAAHSVYAAQVPFRKPGDYIAMGVVKLDGRLVATDPVQLKVVASSPIPGVGQKAPKISTPTVQSVGGDVKSIDTRVPPGTMHDVDYADAYGKRPILLLFSTPALCQVRVCGPVVDIAEQVKASHKGDIAFIHMEIYNDNQIERGLRPQVTAFHLETEPWAFAIDRHGRVAARLEGAFSETELQEAVKAAEAK